MKNVKKLNDQTLDHHQCFVFKSNLPTRTNMKWMLYQNQIYTAGLPGDPRLGTPGYYVH